MKSSVAGRWSSVLHLWVKGEPGATKHNTGGVQVVCLMHEKEITTSKFYRSDTIYSGKAEAWSPIRLYKIL